MPVRRRPAPSFWKNWLSRHPRLFPCRRPLPLEITASCPRPRLSSIRSMKANSPPCARSAMPPAPASQRWKPPPRRPAPPRRPHPKSKAAARPFKRSTPSATPSARNSSNSPPGWWWPAGSWRKKPWTPRPPIGRSRMPTAGSFRTAPPPHHSSSSSSWCCSLTACSTSQNSTSARRRASSNRPARPNPSRS